MGRKIDPVKIDIIVRFLAKVSNKGAVPIENCGTFLSVHPKVPHFVISCITNTWICWNLTHTKVHIFCVKSDLLILANLSGGAYVHEPVILA